MVKSREDVEKLKSGWTSDPCYDIETTEGFEEYHDELLKFRQDYEARREAQRKSRHDYLTSLYCPIISGGEYMEKCKAEKCAWWNDDFEKCNMILTGHLNGQDIIRRER